MERYIPTLSFATAAVAIFHQPQGLSSCATASIAQISTALGLFVIGQTAKYAARYMERHTSQFRAQENYGENFSARDQSRTQSFPPSSHEREHSSYGEETKKNAIKTFIEDIKNDPKRFLCSIPVSDVKWSVVTAGVLAGIGLFFDKGIRWNCMKSAAVISLAQFAHAKLESEYHEMF